MDGSRSREALAQFLDYLSEKGLMEKNTAQSRKAAASKILGILEDSEAEDVTAIDVEDVVSRFERLHRNKYTPQSLVTYKSRLNSAIDDFRSYLGNPLAFRPSTQGRDRPKTKGVKDAAQARPVSDPKPEVARQSAAPMAVSNIIPIPIRADLTIYVQGLPFDLTESEARKIAGVISAMALS